jgi:PPOX class probable F420-dependent enzyme
MSRRLDVQNRFYDGVRSRSAGRAAEFSTTGDFESLRGHKYCLIVTFKRDGAAVPTPVWFGLGSDGHVYFRTGAAVAKVRRLRNDPRVLVAPCSVRGRPLGPSVEGTARVVPPEERERAEEAIQSNYGLGRRFYERFADGVGGDEAYVEVVPSGQDAGSAESHANEEEK